MASGSLALACGEFFQNSLRGFLQFAKAREILLKIMIQQLRVLHAKFRSQNHVAQFYRVRKQRVFLQFFQSDSGVIVVHGFPQSKVAKKLLYSPYVALKQILRE